MDGKDFGELELPAVFDTPYSLEVIHKVYVNVLSHSFQRQGRYQKLQVRWLALSLAIQALGLQDLQGLESFPRAGQAASVSDVKHGRSCPTLQSHGKLFTKKLIVRKDNWGFALQWPSLLERTKMLSAAKIGNDVSLPLIVSNDIESLTRINT